MQKKGAALRAIQDSGHPGSQSGAGISTDGGAANAPARGPEHGGAEEQGDASTSPDQVRGSGGRTEVGGPAKTGGETLPARLDFAPVPRRYRHDGWTPERQRAFIAALADTGCVDRAARMVNMAQTNCYALRRAEGAEEFRRAWDAALDCGLLIMKDIAFERAIEGELVPVFSGGKLMGYRRKRNDALLMFCLRHYAQDAQGRRVTVNYFSTRASAGSTGPTPNPSPEGEGQSVAEASATTVRTVISGSGAGSDPGERAAAAAGVLNGFEGVRLDAEAEAAIAQALLDCAERARAAEAACAAGGLAAEEALADDPEEIFFRSANFHGALELAPGTEFFEPFVAGEPHWTLAGAEKPEALVQWEEGQARRSPGPAEDVRGTSPPAPLAGGARGGEETEK